MNSKHKFLRGIAAAIAATVLVASASVTFASSNGSNHTSGAVNVPTIVLTSNGKVVSTQTAPSANANDIHFVWRNARGCAGGIQIPPVLLEWTYNGTHIDPATGNYYQPVLAPCKVNDFEAGWIQTPTGGDRFTYATWTINGHPVKKIAFPNTANDVELYWLRGGMVTKAWWTFNGKPIAPIILPSGVVINDAHFMLP